MCLNAGSQCGSGDNLPVLQIHIVDIPRIAEGDSVGQLHAGRVDEQVVADGIKRQFVKIFLLQRLQFFQNLATLGGIRLCGDLSCQFVKLCIAAEDVLEYALVDWYSPYHSAIENADRPL